MDRTQIGIELWPPVCHKQLSKPTCALQEPAQEASLLPASVTATSVTPGSQTISSVTTIPQRPELDSSLTASLIFVPTSNLGPIRESQTGTPDQSRRTCHLQWTRLQLPQPPAPCQAHLSPPLFYSNAFPPLLLPLRLRQYTGGPGWLPCYSKLWVHSLNLCLSGGS